MNNVGVQKQEDGMTEHRPVGISVFHVDAGVRGADVQRLRGKMYNKKKTSLYLRHLFICIIKYERDDMCLL